MTRNTRESQPQLSASWASNVGGWEDEVHSSSSQDELSEVNLSNSQTSHLREAIDDETQAWSSHNAARQQSTSESRQFSSNRNSVTDSGFAQAVYGDSPRKRNARSSQQARSTVVMPSVSSPTTTVRSRNMRASAPLQPHQRTTQTIMQESEVRMRSKPSQADTVPHPSPRQRPRAPPKSTEEDTISYFNLLLTRAIWPLLKFVLSILGIAFSVAKPILTYGLAIWLLVGGFIFLKNFLNMSIYKAMTPICRIPGSSLLNLSFCEDFVVEFPKTPAEFDKLVASQASFEEVFKASIWEGNLPADMKRSEMAVRDLRSIVWGSTLPSRNELVFEFTNFIKTARQASNDLSRYNSRIGRGVDKILTTNKWTLQVLAGIEDTEAHRGDIPRFISSLNIFQPFMPFERMSSELMLEQYVRHTAVIQDEIDALIIEAQVLLRTLNNLDDRLDVIGDIAARDGLKAQGSHDELFANLWTKLGGNKQSVNKVNNQLKLLDDVGAYRKMAIAHVMSTIIKLQAIAANLEDLRERVGAPELVGVKDGLPLEMHLEQIRLGVERLEELRREGRQVETYRDRTILDRDEMIGIENKK